MNARELATTLAALRLWQANVEDLEDEEDPIMDLVTDGGRFTRLTAEDIDDLCVRLNVGAEDPDDDPNEGAAVCYACGQILPEDEQPTYCADCGEPKPICGCVTEARIANE